MDQSVDARKGLICSGASSKCPYFILESALNPKMDYGLLLLEKVKIR